MRKTFPHTYVLLAVIVVALLGSPISALASQITEDVKKTIDSVIDIVKQKDLQEEQRREMLRQTISERFNYQQMVMRSLAKDWNDRTPQEREEFIALFKKLLENSYASKIESYQDEKILYVEEIVKGKYALVKTQIVRKDGNIEVDYKLIQEGGQWKVYDFVIEGVSMVRNYRSQFTKIIRKDSYQGLVQKLTTKINELENNPNGKVTEEL